MKMKTHLLSVLVLGFFIFLAFGSSDDSSKNNPDGTPKTERQLKIEEQFSAWDGSHRNLTSMIKESMNDPKSYEHVETRYLEDGDFLLVTTKFRGTNAFGGKVINTVSAKVDLDGNVVEIINQK